MPVANSPVVEVYQLKVTLKRSRPPIWRRIQVADNTTLAGLYRILQIVMDGTLVISINATQFSGTLAVHR